MLDDHRGAGREVRHEAFERREDITLCVRWIDEGELVPIIRRGHKKAEHVAGANGRAVVDARPSQVFVKDREGVARSWGATRVMPRASPAITRIKRSHASSRVALLGERRVVLAHARQRRSVCQAWICRDEPSGQLPGSLRER